MSSTNHEITAQEKTAIGKAAAREEREGGEDETTGGSSGGCGKEETGAKTQTETEEGERER